MANVVVLSTDTFETWRLKTNIIAADANAQIGNVTIVQGNITSLNSALGLTNSNVLTFNTNLQTANTAILNLQTGNTALQAIVVTVNNNLQTANTAITNLQTGNTALQAVVVTINTNLQAANTAIAATNSNVTTVQSNISLLQSNVTLLQAQIGSASSATYKLMTSADTIHVGNVVNIYNNAGTFRIRNAKSVPGFEAHGWITANVTAGQTANVYLSGINSNVNQLTGVTFVPGPIYLGNIAGRVSQSPGTQAGNVVQRIGTALSADSYIFNTEPSITLA